jgi:hypothetical protein
MDTPTLAQDLLAAYGQLVGLANLRFDAHGCARLMFQESLAVDLEVDAGAGCLHAYSVLGPVPAGDREALYRKLLEANLFGTQTGGATLAVDAVQEEVLLCRRVDLNTATATSFAEFLAEFARGARQWRQQFGSGELTAEVNTDNAAREMPFVMFQRA